jgi:hypothetical protein
MGCDIHLFIEHKDKRFERWSGFGGKINPGRDYGIFANLCGVRGWNEVEPISEPRGLPKDIGWEVVEEYTMYVEEEENNCDCGKFCSKEVAESWVKYGSSKMYDENRVTDPDAHSESWATPDELEKVLDIVKTYGHGIYSEWTAVLKVLRHFEESGEEA